MKMATPVNEEPPVKSKRPSSSAFKQQKMPAWQPILTAGTVLPTFFIIGLAFIPIGIGLLVSSNEVQEYQLKYTLCTDINDPSRTCADVIGKKLNKTCSCHLPFNLTTDFKADVFIYYMLTNYYQNHRRYVKSRDDRQLLGYPTHSSSDCEPFRFIQNRTEKEIPIAPCGAIANSLFNDSFSLKYLTTDKVVELIPTGIAWPTDKNVKFRNPEGEWKDAFKDTVSPPNWSKRLENLDKDKSNSGFQNEDLIVWMRTAALPTFRKLYRRVNHNAPEFRNGLPSGKYMMEIDYKYPVTSFKGTKRIIISNTSWLGGKNPFLGVAYIVVGCICLVLAVVFLIIHIKFGKSSHDLVNITQRTPY